MKVHEWENFQAWYPVISKNKFKNKIQVVLPTSAVPACFWVLRAHHFFQINWRGAPQLWAHSAQSKQWRQSSTKTSVMNGLKWFSDKKIALVIYFLHNLKYIIVISNRAKFHFEIRWMKGYILYVWSLYFGAPPLKWPSARRMSRGELWRHRLNNDPFVVVEAMAS